MSYVINDNINIVSVYKKLYHSYKRLGDTIEEQLRELGSS